MEALILHYVETMRPLDVIILLILLYNTWRIRFLTKVVLNGGVRYGKKEEKERPKVGQDRGTKEREA